MRRRRFIQPLFFLLVAVGWLGADLFPAEGWALGTADMQGLFYPWWEYVRNSLFQSHVPFWDPRHFAGSPFLHNPQVAFFYPPTWIVFGLPINIGISFYYLFHLWLAGWGMARLLAELAPEKVREPKILGLRFAPTAAGLAFMLSGFFATRIYAGHTGFLATHVWLPWILVATLRGIYQKDRRYVAPLALFWAMAILAGHTTTLLYLGLIWAMFAGWLILLDPARQIGFSIWTCAKSLVLGLLIAAVQLLPTLQLIRYSGRLSQGGYDFATRFSLPWHQIVSLLIPEWYGEPARIGYWGAENFEELTAYPGIFATMALLLTIMTWRRQNWRSWPTFFGGLAIIGILIALGSNGFLYNWLYTLFPPFRVMRAPGRALFFVAFSAPILLGLLINHVQNQPQWGGKQLRLASIVSLLVWLVLIAGLWLSWSMVQDGDMIGRRWHQLQNTVVVGGAWLIGLLLWRRVIEAEARNRSVWVHVALVGILIVLVADLGWFGRKLIAPQPMTPQTLWFEADQILQDEPGAFQRILPWGINIFAQNGAGQVGLTSIFGYNTLENGAITGLAASIPDPRSKAYDVLGVTHVVSESGLEQFETGQRGLILLDQINTTRVYERPSALPYARLVGRFEVIASHETLIQRLHDPNFEPAQSLLLSEDVPCQLTQGDVSGQVEILERRAGYLSLTVDVNQPAYLIVAETHFPGWMATVDQTSTPIDLAYSALQAVCVPAGQSEVVFVYRPMIFLWGGMISLFGLFALWLIWSRSRQ